MHLKIHDGVKHSKQLKLLVNVYPAYKKLAKFCDPTLNKLNMIGLVIKKGLERSSKKYQISNINVTQRNYTANDCVDNIGFIGGGNIARAIGKGILGKELLNPRQIYVSEPYKPAQKLWMEMGANVTIKNGQVVENCQIIFLAVKSTNLQATVTDIQNTLSAPVKNKIFVSALAGIPLSVLEKVLLPVIPDARIVRSTLNTPLLVGAGCTVLSGDSRTTDDDINKLKTIMSAIGTCHVVPESQMNAAGGIVGCGPAYMYTMLDALSDGAVKMGIPRHLAVTFAAQVMYGSAKMILETGKHPGELKDQVCSPGGTTIAGLHAMERGKIRATLIEAVEAAVNRSEEIVGK
ncbi:pyrroline-5-carboxylate reductase-like [Cephus cinctus]|uniref:Pyrroline-5-carboxylate reductase n=1 Tax=Cephus cinctus TaxID=211228 RepID=A0AAJ7CB11_CEPCN|nr:pyrroline-5-carboxylate reductase-like [Cephus cinctus]